MVKSIKQRATNSIKTFQKVHLSLLFITIITILIFPACLPNKDKTQSTAEFTVFTSILPLEYFVKRIGGERIDTRVLVGPGKNPASYEPTLNQAIALGEAQILFTVGVPFEKVFLPTIEKNLPKLKIIDTSQGIKKRHLESHHHQKDSHDDEKSHDDKDANDEDTHEGAIDPHIWMDPLLAIIQAEHIYKALIEIDPQGKEYYTERYESLIKELVALDKEIDSLLSPFKGESFFVFHPSFGYFADAYGLKQVAIESGGKDPSLVQLEEIIEHAQEVQAKVIFTQPEFSKAAADSIASAIKGKTVVINPLHSDYINNMKNIATEIQKALDANGRK